MNHTSQLGKWFVLSSVFLIVGTCVISAIGQDFGKTFLVASEKNPFFESTPDPIPKPKTWMKTFGGTSQDVGYSVQQTRDGGYIITGFTRSFSAGKEDVWLIKTNGIGDELWERTFGGTESDEGRFVEQTLDGGYIIAGFTHSFPVLFNGNDIWLIKTDNKGNEEWNRTFGGTNSDVAFSVQQTTDEGYIITGLTYSYSIGEYDAWLLKTDDNGNKLWDKTYGGIGHDLGYFVQQTSDNGFIITGYTDSFGAGGFDGWLIKTDDAGQKIWEKTFGGINHDGGQCVQQTADGGYIIIGSTQSFAIGRYDAWLIKTDDNGNILWDKTFGGSETDYGFSIQQTTDDGYIIVGSTNSSGTGESNVWLIKTDSNGNQIWDNIFGGPNSEWGYSVQQTTDSGYIITGCTITSGMGEGDVWLIKTDSQGKSKTTALFNTLWFEYLCQRFPNMFPILRQLMKH